MAVFTTGDLFWILALTVPVLVVLLVLCIDCRDTELDTPPISDYEDKPPTTGRHETFRVLRRPPSPPLCAIQSQPDLRRCFPYSLPNLSASFKVEGDNESIPSYENEEPPCITDDEENYVPGYIVVIPDVPITYQRNENHASSGQGLLQGCVSGGEHTICHSRGMYTSGGVVHLMELAWLLDSIMDQYENMPECQRYSPGEYVNVLEPEATILEPCFAIGANDCTSDQESEDDTPDYENVCPGL